jgi:hypothetical protein
MTLVVREDLSHRTELSKSQLTTADFCQTAAWFGIHDRRPMLPSERLTFGSAIDAACEQMVYAASRGLSPDSKAMQAALEVAARDGMDLDWDEVKAAINGFRDQVMPTIDWMDAVVQPTVRADIEGLGPCSGHPDIILADGTILDVKTGKQHKTPFGTELGFYALLVEAADFHENNRQHMPVPRVGYLTWLRFAKPHWETTIIDVTDELRRYAMARALAFARARDLDAHVNEGESTPVNYTLTGGPKGPGQCATCEYSPANGGPCEIAMREEVA